MTFPKLEDDIEILRPGVRSLQALDDNGFIKNSDFYWLFIY